MGAGAREGRARALRVGGGDGEPAPPTPFEPSGCSSAAGYSTGLPRSVALPTAATSSAPFATAYSIARAARSGGGRAAEAEVEDPRAVVDGVDDRRSLVDVGEGAVGAARLHDHQPGVAGDTGDPVAVRARARRRGPRRTCHGRSRRGRRLPPVPDAVASGDFAREVGRVEVGAGVDHGDRDRRGRARPRRDQVGVDCGVLPLQRHAAWDGGERRARRASARGEARSTRRIPGSAASAARSGRDARRPQHDDLQRGDPPDDRGGGARARARAHAGRYTRRPQSRSARRSRAGAVARGAEPATRRPPAQRTDACDEPRRSPDAGGRRNPL